MEKMHAIEHNADMKKHEMNARLVLEFLRHRPGGHHPALRHPGRSDRLIEDVLISLYMYGVATCRKEAVAWPT
jgi:transposase-like protein